MSRKGIVIIFALLSIFLFANGVANFGHVGGSKFVEMGIMLLCLLLITLGVKKVIDYVAEEKVFVVLYCVEKKMKITEIVMVTALSVITLVTRIVAAGKLETVVEKSRFKYEEILFPAQKLYHDITGLFQGIAGGAFTEYEIANIIMSVLSVILLYLCVKSMYGRSGGFFAMCVGGLWPSHVLGVVDDDVKYLCTLLFIATLYFFLMLRKGKVWPVFALLVGACLGILVYMQTSMYILFVVLLASAIIRGEEGREQTFGKNLIRRLPAVALSLMSACLVISVINGKVAGDFEVEKRTMTGLNGYGLLTGLNIQNNGKENKEDYKFFMDNYGKYHNVKDAHYMCISEAGRRFGENKGESLNLILKKTQYMFGCDYKIEMRKDMERSNMVYFVDAYYLLILLVTGIFAVEFMLRTHHGNINFVMAIGILTVISGALFMLGETVQMEFGYIMAICSGAVVSIVYRRKMGVGSMEGQGNEKIALR